MPVCLFWGFFCMEVLTKMGFFCVCPPRYRHTDSIYRVSHFRHTLLLICSPAKKRRQRTANGCSTWSQLCLGSQSHLRRNVDSDSNSPAEVWRKGKTFPGDAYCACPQIRLQSKALITEYNLLLLMDSSLCGTAFIHLFWAKFCKDAKYQI